MEAASPSINDVLDRFVATEGALDTGFREDVADLLRSYLDGYGHEMLSEPERELARARFDEDEETAAFCNQFGPEYILEGLPGFLGWFVIRKVMAVPEQTAAFRPVSAELAAWLVAEGIVEPGAADGAAALACSAASDLPVAEQLGSLLYVSAEELDHEAVLEYVDWETESSEISRIEPGRLWFRSELGEIGPVIVPPRAAEIAKLGWSVSALLFGRTEAGWYVLEMGNVYPS
jgi:hypothetical protein